LKILSIDLPLAYALQVVAIAAAQQSIACVRIFIITLGFYATFHTGLQSIAHFIEFNQRLM
jgi:hypothetical protein